MEVNITLKQISQLYLGNAPRGCPALNFIIYFSSSGTLAITDEAINFLI
jgi:hypothetical protein